MAIESVSAAINQIAETTLRAVVGRHTLDETLSETDTINQNIREILDVQTADRGIEVTVVELKDSQRAREHEARHGPPGRGRGRREKRAKIIAAHGEALAAGELAAAPATPPAAQAANGELVRPLPRQTLVNRLALRFRQDRWFGSLLRAAPGFPGEMVQAVVGVVHELTSAHHGGPRRP